MLTMTITVSVPVTVTVIVPEETAVEKEIIEVTAVANISVNRI